VDPEERKNRKVNWNWTELKEKVRDNGVLNSLLVAPMPTASTSQIMGNNECFEPYTSNIYLRRTMAGEFVVVNKHLISKLIDMGLWSEDLKNKIIHNGGSVQNIPEIPEDIKRNYKTVWELSMKSIIDQAATRGPFVCQSQSMNLFVSNPSFSKLSSMHFYAWEKGLKTGMYYLRTKPASDPIKFTIDPKYEVCDNCSG
jgi:ribonucleoside-diphosphate reductase alpha chain